MLLERKPGPKCIVHDLLEGPAALACLRLKLGRHVVVEGNRRSHGIMMLSRTRHGVKEGRRGSVPMPQRPGVAWDFVPLG